MHVWGCFSELADNRNSSCGCRRRLLGANRAFYQMANSASIIRGNTDFAMVLPFGRMVNGAHITRGMRILYTNIEFTEW